tara:strand:- start:563 stop:685 length:123 start_codon:yes stop_codon:yes gene_type:complete
MIQNNLSKNECMRQVYELKKRPTVLYKKQWGDLGEFSEFG